METGGAFAANSQGFIRAAEYVRMSTEHQQYSTHNQVARIREYAVQRGIEVGMRSMNHALAAAAVTR